nr:high mobility group protein 20A-like isoform X1 [Procambarus clarkii]
MKYLYLNVLYIFSDCISIMTTGAAGTSNDNSPKKKGWPKGRKRRLLPKDSNAPKGPLSGYMLFMSDQREIIRQSNAGLAFHEITKLVAQRWAQLDANTKTKYLEAAEADKERYQRELEEYQKTDAYKKFMQKQRSEESPPPKKPRKEIVEETKEEEEEEPMNPQSALEIPIFTEEFLNHNKAREAELRQLRKSNTDYEEQNAILQKHIESMKCTVDRLESETSQQRSNNAALQQHIETLRRTLTKAFMSLPLPGTQETPTEESIDSYMVQLHSLIVNNPQQHQSLIQTVRGIVSQLALT